MGKKLLLIFVLLICKDLPPCSCQILPGTMTHGRYALYYICGHIDIEKGHLKNVLQIFRTKEDILHSTSIDKGLYGSADIIHINKEFNLKHP